MISNFKVLNKKTSEFISNEDIIIHDGKLYLNYRDFEDGIHLPSEDYEVMFEESEKRNITKYVGMNRQKLIDKYTAEIAKLRPYCPNRNQSEEKLKSAIYTEFIADLKQLDESHKKIIPKCAHKFIQEGIDSWADYFTIIICADSFANAKPQDEFSKWLRKNSGLFIRLLLNGYEVDLAEQ
ncbi:hypothetical protein ACIJDF_002796 [Enterococcus hirae]